MVFNALALYCLLGLLDCPQSKSEGTGSHDRGLLGWTGLRAVPLRQESSLTPWLGGEPLSIVQ